eukprot:TRINITY_DN47348_c0_g1_i1.p1 TRINITY_DN47348_c0_g1~~TRINITY_DN47348_c0_g1_i1.p1  ORF type:complete len:485 (-),score=60.22 TRINITY_DN47348_c0_g1_i1:361-1815(-)
MASQVQLDSSNVGTLKKVVSPLIEECINERLKNCHQVIDDALRRALEPLRGERTLEICARIAGVVQATTDQWMCTMRHIESVLEAVDQRLTTLDRGSRKLAEEHSNASTHDLGSEVRILAEQAARAEMCAEAALRGVQQQQENHSQLNVSSAAAMAAEQRAELRAAEADARNSIVLDELGLLGDRLCELETKLEAMVAGKQTTLSQSNDEKHDSANPDAFTGIRQRRYSLTLERRLSKVSSSVGTLSARLSQHELDEEMQLDSRSRDDNGLLATPIGRPLRVEGACEHAAIGATTSLRLQADMSNIQTEAVAQTHALDQARQDLQRERRLSNHLLVSLRKRPTPQQSWRNLEAPQTLTSEIPRKSVPCKSTKLKRAASWPRFARADANRKRFLLDHLSRDALHNHPMMQPPATSVNLKRATSWPSLDSGKHIPIGLSVEHHVTLKNTAASSGASLAKSVLPRRGLRPLPPLQWTSLASPRLSTT